VAARGVVVESLFPKDPFWKNVNSAALENLSAWVPALFPVAALQATGAWRVSSDDLGRDLQEDLSIHPLGIVDWGIDDIGDIGTGQRRAGGHTPIDLVKEYGAHANPADAALWLCERLGIDPASLGWRSHSAQHEHQTEAGPLPFINIADWDTKPVPERLWAVEGRIPLLQAYLFTGNGAVGKSLVELMRLVAHTLGKPWLGMSVAQGPAIYMGCEDDADELHRRLADILSYYEATFAEAAEKGLHILSYAGEDCLLGVPEGGIIRPTPLWTRLVEAAMDIRPVAISIDTVADVYGGNEIDRGQVTGFVKMLQGAAIRARCSVGILAHPSVEGMNSGSGISGSTAWHNKVRARAYMRMPEIPKGEEIDSDLRIIQFKKNNYGRQGDTVQVRWRQGIFMPESDPHGLEKLALDQQDDKFFLGLLSHFNSQGRKVSAIGAANNYAPKEFAEEKLDGRKLSKARLEAAMRRLFAAGTIHVEEYGPPSRRHSHLVVGPGEGER
jgi:RecA-family ATPase